LLVEHFKNKVLSENGALGKDFRNETLRLMERYSWPGNARELRNAVYGMVTLAKGGTVEPVDFIQYQEEENAVLATVTPTEPVVLQHAAYLELKESEYFKAVLNKSVSQLEAAQIAGMPKSTFNNKMKKLGIDPVNYLQRTGE
jgi:DNA-binding NtrC family response regulator